MSNKKSFFSFLRGSGSELKIGFEEEEKKQRDYALSMEGESKDNNKSNKSVSKERRKLTLEEKIEKNNNKVPLEIAEFALAKVNEFFSAAGFECEYQVGRIMNEKIVIIIQNEEDRGRIIGKNGLTLRAFQILISQSVFHKFNQRVYVSLDIGNYLKKKDEQMKKKAQEAIRKVKESGEKVVFEPMNASERRIIHMTVKEETGVKSSSDGEGRERFVTIELDEYVAT